MYVTGFVGSGGRIVCLFPVVVFWGGCGLGGFGWGRGGAFGGEVKYICKNIVQNIKIKKQSSTLCT